MVNNYNRLHYLDSLRGIAAIAVVLCHTAGSISYIKIDKLTNNILGVIPVYFFFVLSGFVLAKSLNSTTPTITSILKFLGRRVLRLFPALFFCVGFCKFTFDCIIPYLSYSHSSNWIIVLIQNASQISSFEGFIKTLFLLQKDPNFTPDPTWNPPLWTIRVEFLCSVLLPITILLNSKYKHVKILIFIVSAYMMMRTGYHQAFPCFFAFYTGLIINDIIKKNNGGKFRDKGYSIFTSTLVLLLISSKISNSVVYTLIISQIIFFLITCELVNLKKFLLSKPLLFLGKISYSFYLLHFPIMLIALGLLGFMFPEINASYKYLIIISLFIVTSTATFVLASFSEFFIERPFNKIGHSIFR